MKKFSLFHRLLALLLIVSCLAAPVYAEEPTAPATEEVTAAPSARDLAFGSVCILSGCRTVDGYLPLGGLDRKLDTAQAAFVYERSTGTLVYAYNPDIKVSPGGLAKLVNALVVVEYADLEDMVTLTKDINKRPAGSHHYDLKPDEVLSVNDLLHCMIMQGANDAAIALADHVAGNQTNFVTMMNARVKQMGCTSTEFGNVHGLDNASQYTTARDMTRILMEATRNETIKELISCISYTLPATEKHEERTFQSQNYFIDAKNIQKFFDSRITNGFQSYSEQAGANIVFTSQYNGMDLLFVVMGCHREFYENGWQVKSYGNFEEGQALFRHVFSTYKARRILYNGQALKQFQVSGGECNVVAQPYLDLDSVLPADVQMSNLIMEYTDTGLKAPISAGDMVATVEVWYRNTCLLEAELYAMNDVRATKDSGLDVLGGADRSNSESTLSRRVLTLSLIILVPVAAYLVFNNVMRYRRRAQTRRRRSKGRKYYR